MNRVRSHRAALITVFSVMAFTATKSVHADNRSLQVRLSAGSSWQQSNDVQIPNNEVSSRFSLSDAVGDEVLPFIRLEASWSLNERHGVRVLLAPLEYTQAVTFSDTIRFAGESFSADQPVNATYRFNSWRVGYFYSLKNTEAARLRIGGTLKVRDAEIRLSQGSTESFDDDLGLVPLLYVAGEYRLNDRWTLSADLDGLAGGPGRAIDAGLSVDYAPGSRWNFGLQARVLDGGADTDDVYNFATFTSVAFTIAAEL